MTPDEQAEMYNSAIKEAQKHFMMSPETKEKLNSIEQELKELKTEISHQDVKAAERAKDIEYIKQTLYKIESGLTQLTDEKTKEHDKIGSRQEKIEARIGKLEIKVAVFSALGTLVGTILGPIIRDLLTK